MNDTKEACKNNKSGKYFLFIEESYNEELLLVIPSGEVKCLEASKFGVIEEVNTTDLLNNGLLTQQQIDGYKKFVEKDSIEMFDEIRISCKNEEDPFEIFRIAKERMSMEQYEFVINFIAESLMQIKTNGQVI